MWKWLVKMLSPHKKTAQVQGGDIPLTDGEYDFKPGTRPMLPDGLRELKITTIRQGVLLLENFDADLTVDQSGMDDNPDKVAMAVRSLRWAKKYHDLEAEPQPPVRVHRENLLISSSRYSEANGPEADIAAWLERMRWDMDRPFVVQQATTNMPLEDGYFSCIRITVGDVPDEPATRLVWRDREFRSLSAMNVLANFVREEIGQPWGNKCENYLQELYSGIPRERLTHPVFALLDFPVFDMGIVVTTFAGSVISGAELRFWSRPTYYHK